MIACFLSNISAKYYKNQSMLSRVIAKNVGDVFFETQCSLLTVQKRVAYNVLSGTLSLYTTTSVIMDLFRDNGH